jgi:hypothetical protein
MKKTIAKKKEKKQKLLIKEEREGKRDKDRKDTREEGIRRKYRGREEIKKVNE